MSHSVKESYFWKQVKDGLSSYPMTHLSRIENTAGAGIFDVSGCHGVEAWIELKVFHSGRLHFRNSQRIWASQRLMAGGRLFVLARKDFENGGAEMTLYSAKEVMGSSAYKVGSDNKSFSMLDADLPTPLFRCTKPFNWVGLHQIIFAPA